MSCTTSRRMSARGTCSPKASARAGRVGVGPAASEHLPGTSGRPDTRPPSHADRRTGSESPIAAADFGTDPAPTIADSVTRAVSLVDELDALPQLVDEIELVGVSAVETAIAARHPRADRAPAGPGRGNGVHGRSARTDSPRLRDLALMCIGVGEGGPSRRGGTLLVSVVCGPAPSPAGMGWGLPVSMSSSSVVRSTLVLGDR